MALTILGFVLIILDFTSTQSDRRILPCESYSVVFDNLSGFQSVRLAQERWNTFKTVESSKADCV